MYGTGVRLSQVAGNISQPPIVRLKGTGLLMTHCSGVDDCG